MTILDQIYNSQPTVYKSRCLHTSVQRLFKPTDLPERRLLKHRALPKVENKFVQLQQKLATIARLEGCIAGAPNCEHLFLYWILC